MEEQNLIRFIDTEYYTLFYIKDGERIMLRYPDGAGRYRVCSFIDAYHTRVGNHSYHIFEFARRMQAARIQYVPEKLPELPAHCHSVLPSTGELIMIQNGETGYLKSEFSVENLDENKQLAEQLNDRDFVTCQQEMAMLAGALFGWDTEAAKVEHYDFYGNEICMLACQNHKHQE